MAQNGSAAPFKIRIGGQTDIGGGRENQDSWFAWTDPSGSGTTVFGVLDGHGREVGRLAAFAARDALMTWLERPNALQELRANPVLALGQMFAHAHLAIKLAFRKELESNNWLVEEDAGGYLVRKRQASHPWVCLHGGTACSVLVLLDGARLLTASVGDSSALMTTAAPAAAAPNPPAASGGGATSVPYQITPMPQGCVTRLADLASSHLHQEQVRTPTSSAPVSPGEPSNAFLGERAFAAHSANQPDAPAQLQAWAAAAAASGLNMESGALGGAPSGNWMSDSSSSSSSTSSGSAAAAGGSTGNEPAAAGAAGAGGVDARLPLTGEQLPQTAAEAQAGWWLITADHSPEAPTEFERLRRTRPSSNNPTLPELLMVYDSPSGSVPKASCAPIFALRPQNPAGVPTVTNSGKYYKNVRSEWASLVATPPHALFQDALAFTRSLGDLHLQTYGVSFLPEIFEVNLEALLPAGGNANAAVAILACSDGIWDNWKFEECAAFVVANGNELGQAPADPPLPLGTRVIEPLQSNLAAQAAADRLIAQNAKFAHANFGNSADNATAVVAILSRN